METPGDSTEIPDLPAWVAETWLGLGAAGEFRSPMGTTIMGGMLTSTMLTLLVVPVFYSIVVGFLDHAVEILERTVVDLDLLAHFEVDERARSFLAFLNPAREAHALVPGALITTVLTGPGSSVGLTGTEAIATGVPAFKPPEARNAATTLTVMSIILGTLFVGITFLANGYGLVPNDEVTIIAQSAEAVFGVGSIGFFLFLTFTTLILILAANTSFAAFPVLASVLAGDGFFPRAFSFRGERLAYTLGIVVLGVMAAILIVAFGGSTTTLIPIYATAIFTDFTISQSGMVLHWLRHKTPGWQFRLAVNAVGAAITGVILVSVAISKAPESLLVVVVLPIQVAVMWFIRHEYDTVGADLEIEEGHVAIVQAELDSLQGMGFWFDMQEFNLEG